MSLNVDITIAIPLDTVLAIQRAVNFGGSVTAADNIRHLASRAVVEAVQNLPYRVNAKPELHSATLKRPTGKPNELITLFVRTVTEQIWSLQLRRDSTMWEMANAIFAQQNVLPGELRLIFNGRQIFTGCEEDEDEYPENKYTVSQSGMTHLSTCHAVLKLRGS